MGVDASSEICRRKKFPKPVIAPFVVDAEMQGLPIKEGTSGVQNLCYINSYKNFEKEVRQFKKLTPYKKLSVLVSSLTLQMHPYITDRSKKLAAELKTDDALKKLDAAINAEMLRTAGVVPPTAN